MISMRFCSICGAANGETRAHCFACGQLLPIQADEHTRANEMLLHERYRLGTTLGEGGYSAVYRGWDTHEGEREVAIKQITLRGLNAEETIEATNTYNREIEALSALNHPQVPHLYDHFNDAGHWYLVLEYIQGQTLETFLGTREAQNKPLHIEEILTMGLQLCSVLEHLHTRHPPIIFRDLKPGNIMRAPAGKLYLIDFGIARRYTPGQRHDTQSLGSPGYAAPEQYGRAQTDARADIYSLGALLQQLLSGHDPSEERPGLLPTRFNGRPGNADLEALITRMLASDPQNRPASASDLRRELERIRQCQHNTQQTGRIWQPPTPQDYNSTTATIALASSQFYRQHATFVQPALGAALKSISANTSSVQPAPGAALTPATPNTVKKPARRKRITRRRVLYGLGATGALTLATSFGIGFWRNVQPIQALYTYRGHTRAVNSIAWTIDSQHIASASADFTVRIWDALNGNDFSIMTDYTGMVNSVAFSFANTYATGSANGSVQAWDTQEKLLLSVKQIGPVNSVAWSPDVLYIASANSTVSIWDPFGQKSVPLATIGGNDGSLYTAVTWSPDGQYIAASNSATTVVESWNARNMTALYNTYSGHTEAVTCLAWSPDGVHIAAGADDSMLLVWSTTLGTLITTYAIPNGSILALSWSPNSKYIAAASDDGIVRVWSTFDGSIVTSYTGHSGPVRTVAWSPSGQYIASAGEDMTVQVWNAPQS